MLCYDTFLISLYVLIDDFCKDHPALVAGLLKRRGEQPALSPSETATLSIFGQWRRFQSEREAYRFAEQRLRPLFPRLPARTQFNRAQRRYAPLIVSFFQHVARELGARQSPYEIVDRCGVATRASGRRGGEWLPGRANKGLCTRLGYFHGLQLMCALTREGVITGFGLAAGSTKDQPMAESFFALRACPRPTHPWVGEPAAGRAYLLHKGFSGPRRHRQWKERYEMEAVCAPQRGHGPPWPRTWRRWLASLRQMIETVHNQLLNTFRLKEERAHSWDGLTVRISAKAALHNVCIWLNRQLGRPDLATADLLGW